MTPEAAGSLIVAAIAVIVSVTAAFQKRDLYGRVVKLETKMEFLISGWKSSARDSADILHSPDPNHAERDRLLEAFRDDRINGEDLLKLARMMRETVGNPEERETVRLAASNVLRAIEALYQT